MKPEIQTWRSQLVQITPLPQLVPNRVCLSCDVCCRFPEPDSSLRPYFTAEEIRRAIDRGVAPAQFADLNGCQVSVVPSPVSDGYLCPAFDPVTSHCRMYDVRPLDCQIYPVVVMWNVDRTQVVLGWDSKCPFLRGGQGGEVGVAAYADRIAGLLEQEDTLETFAKNPRLIGRFQDDVVLLRPLPSLTERTKAMRDESSVMGEPPPPSTHHSALSTHHSSSLTLADRPRFARAVASVESPLAAYGFAPHFVWRALFSYSWTDIDGHLCLFAEYPDGVYMP
ncbi:MAG: YkgJ family cysteine cluster protein, partial [Nitrospiraceae bacterium]